jgi:Ca2+-transporting ATPase
MLLQASLITAGTFGSYAWGRFRYTSEERASTMAFMSITTAQLLHMLGCRSERYSVFSADAPEMNMFLKAGLAIGIGLQGATIAFPPLRRLLKNTHLSPLDLAVSFMGAGLPTVMNEAIKYRRLPRHNPSGAAREPDSNAGSAIAGGQPL